MKPFNCDVGGVFTLVLINELAKVLFFGLVWFGLVLVFCCFLGSRVYRAGVYSFNCNTAVNA